MDNNEPVGKVSIKLSSRGMYTWSIEVPLKIDSGTDQHAITRLQTIDRLLKDTFVDYPKKSGGRFKEVPLI